MLNSNHTVKSYSGKIGCMCGCIGTYNESERARKRAITDIVKMDGKVQDFNHIDADGIAGCIFAETDTRNRVLYLTKDGIEEAKKILQEVQD